jgi:Response regulator containing CheY-like receiver, AAA-type ATPase, and DNA-binding domains
LSILAFVQSSSLILHPENMARKNILVVDDEKSQREILEMILSEEGYDVTTAASGEAQSNSPKTAASTSHLLI